MKIFLTSAIFVFCLFSFAVSAQDVDKSATITVSGTAEIQVAPDEVVFSLDVTKLDKDLQAAKRQNDETVGKVLELTRRFGVLPQNVKTDNISVEMKYEQIRNAAKKVFNEDGEEIGNRIFKGYEVSKTVNVRLTDISRFEEFFAEALKTGITEIGSVKFETSKLRENRDKARDAAMKAAREKASAMAAAIGQTIGKALRINESGTGVQPYGFAYGMNANSTGASGSFSESVATFAAGSIKVEAQVTVTFLLN